MTVVRVVPKDTGGGGSGRTTVDRPISGAPNDLLQYIGSKGDTVTWQNPFLQGSVGLGTGQASVNGALINVNDPVRPQQFFTQSGATTLVIKPSDSGSNTAADEADINAAKLRVEFPSEVNLTHLVIRNSYTNRTDFRPPYKFTVKGIKLDGSCIELADFNGNPGDYWVDAPPVDSASTAEVVFALPVQEWVKKVDIEVYNQGNTGTQGSFYTIPFSQIRWYGEIDITNIVYGKNKGVEDAIAALTPDFWLPLDVAAEGIATIDGSGGKQGLSFRDAIFYKENHLGRNTLELDTEMGQCWSSREGLTWVRTNSTFAVGSNGYSLGVWFKTCKRRSYKQTMLLYGTASVPSTSTSFTYFARLIINQSGELVTQNGANLSIITSGEWIPDTEVNSGIIVDDNQWHFVCITASPSGTGTLYLDGVNRGTWSQSAFTASAGNLRIADGTIGTADLNYRFGGLLKHATLWSDRVLLPAEQLSIWNGFA